MSRSPTPYRKPFLDLGEQVKLLRKRGMQIADQARAEFYLGHLNYYRLGAYWLPFEKDHATHSFLPGTSFDRVLELYVFDRRLRLLVLDAIERIEVSVRACFAHELAAQHGPHPHLKPALFDRQKRYRRLVDSLTEEVERSSEDFIRHLRASYEEPLPPIWATVEVMSLGQLSSWYSNLARRHDARLIADHFDMDSSTLKSLLHHLTVVRNVCAHHSRLWNREFAVTVQIPRERPAPLIGQFNGDPSARRRLYNALLFCAWLLDRIAPGNRWVDRLLALLDEYRIDAGHLGFPDDWPQLAIWKRDPGVLGGTGS